MHPAPCSRRWCVCKSLHLQKLLSMKLFKYVGQILACFVIPFALHGQNALHDALALRNFCGLTYENGLPRAILTEKVLVEDDNGNLMLKNEVAKVLSQYTRSMSGELTQAKINSTFGGDVRNPFLRIALTSMSGVEFSNLEATTTLPAPGNPVSTIVDGIARFLVKRTKAELSLAFFEDFKQQVERDPWLQYFFPVTRQMLLGIDTEVYQFQIYMDALRDAFISDLKVLPGSMETYLRENPTKLLKPAEQAVCVDFFHVVQGFMSETPPQDIISYCSDLNASEIQAKSAQLPELQDLAGGLQLLNLFSQALVDPAEYKWYSGQDIKKALGDSLTFNIFMGLLWQQSRSIPVTFRSGLKIDDLIGKTATAASLLNSWRDEFAHFGQLGSSWEDIQKSRPTVAEQDSNQNVQIPLLEGFYRTLQIFSRLMESTNTVYQLINPDQPPPIAPDQIKLVQQIGGLTFNISRGHYSAGVGNAVAILDLALEKKFKGKNTFLRYGSFIGAVADAENAQEVENALDMFALPPGSSKAKKGAGKFSIAINAYTGLAAGAERFSRSNTSYGVGGITAPIGISLNWGQTWGKGKQQGAIGVFVPVIDVGAVFAYRFKNDNTVDNLPPMSWKNILAPGAYFVVDPPLGKWPVSIGLGGQFGPLLRRVSTQGAYENQEVNAFRIGGFLTFDIPITFLKLRNK